MKKIIGLLLVTMAVFFNIDGADAENMNLKGNCSLESDDSSICVYSCSIDVPESYGFTDSGLMTFDFYANFSATNNVDKNFYIDNVSLNSKNFYHLFNYESVDEYKISGFSSTKLLDQPVPKYFFVNGQLKCRNVIPRVDIDALLPTNLGLTIHNEIIIETDPNLYVDEMYPGGSPEDNVCGLLGGENSKTVGFIKKIYDYIKIVIPLLIVALAIVDFIKVLISGKDDDMKKALSKFIKRIIIAVVFVLVPIIITLIINISGVAQSYTGLGDGVKAIFCILG